MKRLWQYWLARTGRRPVYVCAAWWRDCEAFAGVVALTVEDAQARLSESIDEEYSVARMDAYDEANMVFSESDLCWSGVSSESLSSLHLNADQMRDLRVDGYCWQETP